MISVVIPSYNRCDSVLRLLHDVYQQTGVEFEVILVDDQSRDGTVEAVRAAYPSTRLLCNETNRGPAVTRNRGIREARGDIVVGFDSDVTLPDRLLLQKTERAFAQLPEVDAFAFRLLGPDGVSEDADRWWHPLPLKSYATRPFPTFYFSGTGYAFRKEALVAAGLFPEILFMHYEEVELAYRLIDSGRTLLYFPDLAVVHHEHRVSRRSEVRDFFKPRNQVLLAAACFPFGRALTYLLPRLGFHLIRSVKEMNLRPFIRAMNDAARKLPTRLRERRPLRRETFARMAAMKRGELKLETNNPSGCLSIPPTSASSV